MSLSRIANSGALNFFITRGNNVPIKSGNTNHAINGKTKKINASADNRIIFVLLEKDDPQMIVGITNIKHVINKPKTDDNTKDENDNTPKQKKSLKEKFGDIVNKENAEKASKALD